MKTFTLLKESFSTNYTLTSICLLLILVVNLPYAVTAQSNKISEKTISSLPHFEDFSLVTTPGFPPGWTTDVQTTLNSVVETSSLQNPYSMPFHVRFRPIGDDNAQLILITPEITTDLNLLRVRFYARGNNATGNAVQVGTYNPAGEGEFTPYSLVQINDEYAEYLVELDNYTGDDSHIAFKAVQSSSYNTVFFDDVLIDEIPTGPVLFVSPETYDFGQIQTSITSHPRQFTISNQGIGVLTIEPGDIQITGADASQYILNNITETITLGELETAQITISFAPESTGDKQAILQVQHREISLLGEGIDATISETPYLQDFNDITTPKLPFGWTEYVDNSSSPNARVETSTTGTPISPPQHVRLYSNTDPTADVLLISPPVEDLKNKKISFWARGHMVTGLPDLIIGTMTDPTDVSTFVPFHTLEGNVDISNVYTHFEIFFNPSIGEDSFIAFKFGDNAMQWVFLYIDSFLLEDIPDEPLVFLSPGSHDYGQSQIGLPSSPREFSIMNHGGGVLEINPGDISITGENANYFSLENITETIELTSGESTTIQVSFVPETLGTKNATLQVLDQSSALTGEGFDFTVDTFPWDEDFSGIATDHIPGGWTRDTQNWGVSATSQAGGTSPEMRFRWSPEYVGESYLKTPPINTSGFSSMQFSFKSLVNNFLEPGIYTLSVITIVDGVEHTIIQWEDPDHIPAQEYIFTLTGEDHGIGADNLQIAWVFEGTSEDINRWNIDDIKLQEAYSVTFNVRENSTEQIPVEGALIQISGQDPLYTDASGLATHYIATGNYSATISKPGYVSQEIDFSISDNLTLEVNLMDNMIEPFGLQVSRQEGNPEEALFEWMTQYDEFRYDNGTATGQLGFNNGTVNSVMGAVHHATADLYEMSWFLTDNGGPHDFVNIWVLGLDQLGYPDRDNVLYSAVNVANTDMQWNTYEFENVLEAEDGFFIGISTQGFLALATEDGDDEQWPFIHETQFAIQDITDLNSDFTAIESWDFHRNYLIRGYGQEFSSKSYPKGIVEAAPCQAPIYVPLGKPLPTTPGTGKEKILTGFNIYLNDMQNPMATNVLDHQYVFTDLEEGTHTAGVQGVYSTGVTAISTLEFVFPIEVPLFSVTFEINSQEGDPITDAVITFDGHTHEAGTYVFDDLEAGNYQYLVSREGFSPEEGTASVTNNDIVLQIVMQEEPYEPELFEVTFNVDMANAGYFDPDNHQVFISGNFDPENQWPEPGTDSDFRMNRVGSSMIFSVTMELEASEYHYKYYSNAYGQGWEGGEWEGEPNRLIHVEDNLAIDDIWAVYGGVSVMEPSKLTANIFPNPATSYVTIMTDSPLKQISIYNIQGQLLFTQKVNSDSNELNVSELRNGIYLVHIQTVSGSITKQLTISR